MTDVPSLQDLCDAAGLPAPAGAESAAVLRLARVVAHGGERRWAPLVSYAVGLAAGAAGAQDPQERCRRVDAVLAVAERYLAAEGPQGGAGG